MSPVTKSPVSKSTVKKSSDEADAASGKAGSESLLTVLIALAANTVIAVMKSVVAAITGSASMMAEAVHSWADAGNEIFLLIAERRSSKPADSTHLVGYGRAAYVWSMVAAFGLFAVGSAVSVIHGINSLRHPEPEADYLWAYVVLGAAFVLESVSFLQARRQLKAGAEAAQMSRLDFLSSTPNPTLRAVFFEDAAALIGIVLAAAGILAHQLTGNAVWDSVGSILVGLLLGAVAIYLLQRNMAFLVGQVADQRIHDRALNWLLAQDEVEHVTALHLEWVGPDKLFIVGAVDLVGDDAETQAAIELARLEHDLEEHPSVQKVVLSLTTPGDPPLVASA